MLLLSPAALLPFVAAIPAASSSKTGHIPEALIFTDTKDKTIEARLKTCQRFFQKNGVDIHKCPKGDSPDKCPKWVTDCEVAKVEVTRQFILLFHTSTVSYHTFCTAYWELTVKSSPLSRKIGKRSLIHMHSLSITLLPIWSHALCGVTWSIFMV